MSTEPNEPPNDDPRDSFPPEGADDDPMRALLKRSLGTSQKAPPPILPSVQKKLRERSRGKFYGDGWSTVQGRLSYVLAAAIMLTLAVLSYLALGPHGIGK